MIASLKKRKHICIIKPYCYHFYHAILQTVTKSQVKIDWYCHSLTNMKRLCVYRSLHLQRWFKISKPKRFKITLQCHAPTQRLTGLGGWEGPWFGYAKRSELDLVVIENLPYGWQTRAWLLPYVVFDGSLTYLFWNTISLSKGHYKELIICILHIFFKNVLADYSFAIKTKFHFFW